MEKQHILDFYTFTSRDVNIYSEFPKKFKAFVRGKDNYTRYLPSQQYVYPIIECTLPNHFAVNVNYKGKMTPEQLYVTDIIGKRMNLKYHCGLINMKTGKGKSHIIMNIVSLYSRPTLILCHNKKTLLEMVEKFKEFTDYVPGVYYGEKKNIKEITITTHDSFVLNEGDIGRYFDVIIYDECDYDLSQQMFNALCKSGANAMYGLTGTPYTKHFNNADMQKIFGKQIQYKEDENDLGYNMIPKIETYRYKSEEFKNYEYQNWAEEKQCLVDDKDRLKEQIKLVHHLLSRGRRTILILTERVEEAKNYYDILKDNPQYHLGLITGESKIKDDNEFLELALKPNQQPFTIPTIIIGTVGKMARGVDIPAIDTILLFSALHFRGTVVQAVGRCLRKHSGKQHPLLIDWQDYPLLANQWYERKKAYKKEYGLKDEEILFYNITENGGYSRK